MKAKKYLRNVSEFIGSRVLVTVRPKTPGDLIYEKKSVVGVLAGVFVFSEYYFIYFKDVDSVLKISKEHESSIIEGLSSGTV